ncbi:hypothetical protein SKAU_G00174010 [Synaphobranchus kaupii]|uniref:C2H2-type domain-containing protein n=1 Tax=Synaphobranchus kaupii TaxID=118154 RepID=A0A9Q1FL31_SYNKA|nr:hypothetical protein SKAU_G00174010 [Synaphobranchus kaupii]
METGKQGFVSIPAPGSSVTAQGEDRMREMQTPLPAMYLQTLGRLPLYPQVANLGRPTGQDAVALPLSISQLPTKQALPLLTFHITGGMHLQQQGQRSGMVAPPTRPKSAGKHVCPHCGRDCLKPSVLEKHLRCHTGERPYPCTVCGIAFKTQSNLYKHKRTQAHARLSSESEKGSFSSQESIPGSGDTCSSSPTLGAQSEDLESFEREVGAPPGSPCTTSSSAQPTAALGKIGPDTGWALHQAALVGLAPVNGNQEKLCSIVQKAELSLGLGTTPTANPPKAEGEQRPPPAPLMSNRHLLLQRQEATFFSKHWESSTSRGKSQSHDSTDSGFSESNEQHWTSSPSNTLHDHSMESLTESSMELQEDHGPLEKPTEPAGGAAAGGAKSRVSMLEKRKLEERISKLISENETLVDDKCLENVRPRKTVLSKQGSIDLPMPYTYKDSFHFEMRTSKQMSMASSQQSLDRRVKQALYNSVPTQQSTSLNHVPLTRSSSLPFSLGSPGLERSSQYGHYQRDGVLLGRRDSSGQLYSGEFVMKSVDQQSSHHRSLVRQSAVDCLPAGEGLNVTSSMEDTYPSSLGSEGDSVDAIGESGSGKCRRKKAQKFSYSKWHMYGGGTFTKLYSTEKGSDHGSLRAKKAVVSTEQGKSHEIQSRNIASLPEPVASVVSTADLTFAATNIQTACRPTCLPDILPSTCSSQPAQEHSSHLSSETHLQRSALTDLSSSMHHSVDRQGSLPAPDCTNGSRAGLVKDIIQEEQNTQHNTTPPCLSHLPSERKKQRTEDGTGMPADIIDLGEEGRNVLACIVSKAGDNNLVRPNQPSPSFCSSVTPKHIHPTKRGDSNKLELQHQGRMDLNLCFIRHHLDQRSLQSHSSAPSIASKLSNTYIPKPAIKQNHSTPNSLSTQTPTAGSTSSETCAASPTIASGLSPTAPPTSGHIHTAPPTLTSEQNHNAMATPAPELSHTAAPTLGQMHTASPQHSATSMATPKLSDTATPSSVCANRSTHFPMEESLSAGKVILLKGVSHTASEDTDYVKTGDIQIFLQIISEEQLSLMEAHLNPQNSQLEASVCQDISQAAVENDGAGMQQQSVSQQLNNFQYSQLLANNAQGHNATDMAHASPSHRTSSAQSSGPSIPSYWEIFSHTEQHQEYQACEKSGHKNSPLLKSIPTSSQDFTNPPAQTDIGECDGTPAVPGYKAGGSEPRSKVGQFVCVHTEPQMHDQCRPADYGFPPLTRNFECPNQEPSKEVSVDSMGVCHQDILPQQRIRADRADFPGLLYSQAPTSSMASSTATVDRSAYPRPYIPDPRSAMAETHTNIEKQTLTGSEERGCAAWAGQKHQKLPMEMPLAVQKNAVNAAGVPPLHMDCRDPLTSQGPKNKMHSTHKHHLYPPPNSLHVWDVAKCADGHFSSDPMHCQNATPSSAPRRMERPTSAEAVGGGDTSSTSHRSPASNRLFIHPRAETPHPTAVSQHSAQTSTCEGPSLFQGSKTKSPAARQCTTDTAEETSHQVDLGHGSLLTDLSQRGTDIAVLPLTPHPGLQDPIQACPPCVTQELPQQVTSEHATPCSVPPEHTEQQQTQNKRHALEASACNSSTEPFLQASLTAIRASQQKPFSGSLPGQHKLCLAADISLSPSEAAEIGSGNVLLHVSVQQKPINQRVQCNVGKQRTKCAIWVNEATVSPRETSEGFRMVRPACSIRGSDVVQAGLGTVRQSTEASSPPFLSDVFSGPDREVSLPQDPVACAGTSAGTLQTERPKLTLKSSNTLCGLSTRPLGRSLSGGALSVSSLMSSQMQVSSNEAQDQIVFHQSLEQAAPKDKMATGQEDMASDSFASSPLYAPEERQKDGTLICADTQKGSQDLDAGHLYSRGSVAQPEQGAQGSRRSLKEQMDGGAEEQGSRRRDITERGGAEETDSGETENRDFINLCTSALSEPYQSLTTDEDVRDRLDDNGSLSNRDSSVLPHFAQTSSQRETAASHTLQSHTPEACPLPVNAGQLGCGKVAQPVGCGVRGMPVTPPLQRTFVSVGSRVQREGLGVTAQADARSPAERPEQPTPAVVCTHPFLSHNSAAHCSVSLSVRASEASVRAGHSSLEEPDTSSSDDEGRLVIELE